MTYTFSSLVKIVANCLLQAAKSQRAVAPTAAVLITPGDTETGPQLIFKSDAFWADPTEACDRHKDGVLWPFNTRGYAFNCDVLIDFAVLKASISFVEDYVLDHLLHILSAITAVSRDALDPSVKAAAKTILSDLEAELDQIDLYGVPSLPGRLNVTPEWHRNLRLILESTTVNKAPKIKPCLPAAIDPATRKIRRVINSFPCLNSKLMGWSPKKFDPDGFYRMMRGWSHGELLCGFFILNVWNPDDAKEKGWSFNLFEAAGTLDSSNRHALMAWLANPIWP